MHKALLFLAFICSSFGKNEELIQCTVVIENIKSDHGKLMLAVFDNENDFLKEEIFSQEITVTGKSTENVHLKLPKGEFAIAVFHDTNGNNELDKNFIGWPKEAFGFSNKSLGLFGPPSFQESKFTVPTAKEVKVVLKHF